MKSRFDQLRKKAAQKRDQQLRTAQTEFKAVCRQIDALERMLPVKGKRKRGHRSRIRKPLTAYYNFCRKHETIKTTPAVKSGLAPKPWSIKELLAAAA